MGGSSEGGWKIAYLDEAAFEADLERLPDLGGRYRAALAAEVKARLERARQDPHGVFARDPMEGRDHASLRGVWRSKFDVDERMLVERDRSRLRPGFRITAALSRTQRVVMVIAVGAKDPRDFGRPRDRGIYEETARRIRAALQRGGSDGDGQV